MKIKSILSLAVIAGVTLFASSAYAATESYSVGTPIDLSTGAAVEEYKVGQIVALPVDFESSTGSIQATGISLNFDNSVLSYGADLSSITSDSVMTSNLMSLGEVKFNSDSSKVMLVNGLFSKNVLTGAITGIGTMYVPDEATDGTKVKIPWASGGISIATKDTPELYIIFTVTGTISKDSLNVELVTVNDSECNIGDNESHLNVSGTVFDKINACDGAFKIVVDGSQLPYWVQGVDVEIDGTTYPLDACVNAEGETEYSFPVRLTSAADEASVSVAIKAQVSDTEAGPDTSLRDWGTVTVDMSGTATTYAANNIDLSK
ncbi:MAG: hypothetical protein Q4D26_01240 [Clostridia bacterium]|nr:hypothetical protein [Clostridia bacterium]